MPQSFDETDSLLRNEADCLLDSLGLRAILSEYGEICPVGSYALGLMTWRDLDITLSADDLSLERFFEMGERICAVVHATSMFFRDTRAVSVDNRPRGLYWGIVFTTEAHNRWQWDIWAVSPETCRASVAYCEDILERLTPETRSHILGIKSSVYDRPEYGREYGSKNIYRAVLNHGVVTIADFDRHILESKQE